MRWIALSFTVLGVIAASVWSQMDTPPVGEAPVPAELPSTVPGEMGIGRAVVLGVVEGVTEYLPVSSTGHLILTQRAMGLGGRGGADKDAADAFAICIQAGAILAVLGLYRRHVWRMLRGLAGRDPEGRRLAINLILAFAPAAIVGLTLSGPIKQHLFGLWPVTAAWFVGGVAILIVAQWRKRRETESPDASRGLPIERLTARMALLIGLCQCLAMWPGTSRALVTIVGGLLVGLSLAAAVEFSFLLGVVTLGAATAYDTLEHGELMLNAYGPWSLIAGTIAATVSAAIAVKWMVGYLNAHGLAIFGWYRVALAIVVAALILRGVLEVH